jgi:hypothetical protein
MIFTSSFEISSGSSLGFSIILPFEECFLKVNDYQYSSVQYQSRILGALALAMV